MVNKIGRNDSKSSKEGMIEKLVNNLPALRANLGITPTDLANSIGIGRQTLIAIKNKRGRMRWDIFLATIIVFSENELTSDYITFLGIHLESGEKIIHEEISDRKEVASMRFKKIWTDYESNYDAIRGICQLPISFKDSSCPKYRSKEQTGALISPTAYEQDSNIIYKNCGYCHDYSK